MTRHPLLIYILATLLLSCVALAGSPAFADTRNKHLAESLARQALAEKKGESEIAAAELRSMGPEGLRAFLEANGPDIEAAVRMRAASPHQPMPAQSSQVLSVLDSVCQQKDCYASKLFWYTDFDQARSAARAQGKPILSLRLLGRLDEDLSCANSRLFRIALYANEAVSKLLRESFVLHWQSVRPVPKLTIDFGDGRKMERTLTGNSIHYVLDAEGRVIDALPGMYGPGAFLRELVRASSVAAKLATLQTGEERDAALRLYHESRLNELESAWLSDVKRAGLPDAPSREIPGSGVDALNPPSAQLAAVGAVSKAVMVERPILRGISDAPKILDSIGGDIKWSMIAGLHARDAILDQATRALIVFKDPSLTGGKLELSIAKLERAIAEDTVRNEYVFRTRIDKWLASREVSADVAALNDKIYAQLFLTPGWDPWLGLRPAGAYSGIDDDGIRK